MDQNDSDIEQRDRLVTTDYAFAACGHCGRGIARHEPGNDNGGWWHVESRVDHGHYAEPADRIAVDAPKEKPRRPYLRTYRGVRVDQRDDLYVLYEYLQNNCGKHSSVDAIVLSVLYELAGSGGWDDVCEHCPQHRYEHRLADHPFISEEQ